jgi:hypothetical protein
MRMLAIVVLPKAGCQIDRARPLRARKRGELATLYEVPSYIHIYILHIRVANVCEGRVRRQHQIAKKSERAGNWHSYDKNNNKLRKDREKLDNIASDPVCADWGRYVEL